MNEEDKLATRKRRHKKIRLGLDLQRTKYILPNLFTLSSIFFGFATILLLAHDQSEVAFRKAVICLSFALFCDIVDGRVARLTKTQSQFGLQLDSLADAISFGVVPGFMIYQLTLHQLGALGVFLSFLFVACGALRLARFNVLAQKEESSCRYFIGLPIPLAAGMIVALSIVFPKESATHVQSLLAGGLTLALSYLMVSNVKYRTFKKMGSKRQSLLFYSIGSLSFVLIFFLVNPAAAFFSFFGGYVLLGIIESLFRLFFKNKKQAISSVS